MTIEVIYFMAAVDNKW